LLLALTDEVEGKKYAVLNYQTCGLAKAGSWKFGDKFDIEVQYQVGVDALLVTAL
jgi:hypothetical protein